MDFETHDRAIIDRLTARIEKLKAQLAGTDAGREAEARAGWAARDKLAAAEARVKELEGALRQARHWMIPGMNWSDEIGKFVIQQVDAALASGEGKDG